jgi:signal peptidase II
VKKKYLLIVCPTVAVLLLDQITKWVVLRTLDVHQAVTLVSGFLNLVHVRNRGMAFGFLNRPGSNLSFYFLVGATVVAIILLVFWALKLKREEYRILPGLSLILGGALGNLIDRFRLHAVIDFLDIHLGQYHWPAFNVADSAITVGTIWVALNLLFRHSPRAR